MDHRRALRIEWLERALAVALFAYALAELRQHGEQRPYRWMAPVAVSAVLAGAQFLSLGWLRADTLRLAPVALGVPALYAVGWGTPESGPAVLGIAWLGFVVGMYRGGHRRPLYTGLVAMLAVVEVRIPGLELPTDPIFVCGVAALPFAAGRVVVHRQRLAEQLRAQQPLVARAAVVEERTRIARELHDVVAHSVSVMVIQAVAGRAQLHRDAAKTDAALRTVEATGKEALAELRRLLGVLRSLDDGDADLQPQPGLADLDALVRRADESGVRVDVAVSGEPAHLAPGVELAAYRIVQEALTNVIRHAGVGRARVRVAHEPRAVVVEVVDDGRGGASPVAGGGGGGGHGLAGMRERAALYGGELQAGPLAGGGFSVRARLPLEAG